MNANRHAPRRIPRLAARQKGFTMAELMITLSVAIAIMAASVPLVVQKAEHVAVAVASDQINTMGEVAQQYRIEQGKWPGETSATPCDVTSALNDLVAKNYLITADPSTVWANNMVTACPLVSGNRPTFTVSAIAPNSTFAQEAASRLHTSSVSGATVTSSFPSGIAPVFDKLLHRYYDPAHPEYNEMQTAINMKNNAINNASTVSWANGESSLNVSGAAGTIELGSGQTSTYGHAIDFHLVPGENYNVRLVNQNDGFLTGINKDGGLNILARGLLIGGVDAANGKIYPGDITSFGGINLCNPLSSSNYAAQTADNPSPSLGCNLQANDGFIESRSTTTAFSAPNGSYIVGPNGAGLTPDQGGALELGAGNGKAATGTPYIDFHYGSTGQDYNTRLIASADRVLHFEGAGGANGTIDVKGDIVISNNLEVKGREAAQDVVSTVTGKSLAQSITYAGIVSPGTTIPKPNCSPLGLTPRIFTAVSKAAQGPTATPIYQVDTAATDNGSSWTANMVLTTETGSAQDASLNPNYNRILVLAKCD